MKRLIALVLLFGWGAAPAYPLTWTVDATGDFGQVISGTFDFDAYTGTYTEVDLQSAVSGWVQYLLDPSYV